MGKLSTLSDTNFKPKNLSIKKETSGKVGWQSPSNLAIVKYWGKYGRQLPSNPSLSITLSEAHTRTQIEYEVDNKRKDTEIQFSFEGVENNQFKNRIIKFFSSIEEYLPFLIHSKLVIKTENSFPHSSGIASSASGMSALALCLCSIERELEPEGLNDKSFFFRKSSFISRLGSGSACRSVYPYFGLWGEADSVKASSNLYATPFEDFDPLFKSLRNDILIVSTKKKSVSSSAGHQLMKDNVYASTRFSQATHRTNELITLLSKGDIAAFGEMLESEALTLHALMMASDPSYLLMEPNTLSAISQIRRFRKEKGIPVYFSLDAGPNIHIISFEDNRSEIEKLLSELEQYAVEGRILKDKIGIGAKRII